jgi:hypothetical protein
MKEPKKKINHSSTYTLYTEVTKGTGILTKQAKKANKRLIM